MESVLEFLSNNEMTIIICLMVIIFGLILTIIIIDIFSRRNSYKEVNNDDIDEEDIELNKEEMDINSTGLGMVANEALLDEIDVEAVTKNLEKTQEIEEIKYVEEDEDLEKTKALLELESIKQELEKIENQDYLEEEPSIEQVSIDKPIVELTLEKNIALEELEEVKEELSESKEQEYLEEENEVSTTYEDEVEKFESDQEEHAIISVEELTKASLNITDEEIASYEDDGNEPISIKELEAMYKSVEAPIEEKEEETKVEAEEKITLPDFDIKVKAPVEVYEDKNFKNTPVISPVFGIKTSEEDTTLEHTANLDKLSEEMKKTNEFLSTLKELRKNLD